MITYKSDGTCHFSVWAPYRKEIFLKLHPSTPDEKQHLMSKNSDGYHSVTLDNIPAGTRYMFSIEGEYDRPDPASNYQPVDLHGPSEIIDHSSFKWTDSNFIPPSQEDMIIYELHTGTFTEEGTFDAAAKKLDYLADLGINTVELMPVSQFPGSRNWGYDGALPYAVQNSYGGPDGLRRFVDACHQRNMAVILDVVYNHLGPEGNYLGDFFPWYNEMYKTPWGFALNFDGPESPGLRRFFLDNAIYWLRHYHIDGLRLDAVHAIYDMGARHFLKELADEVRNIEKDKRFLLIAESDLNDVKLLHGPEAGGYGLDGQWSDDFHHALRTLLTGENRGYYQDFGDINNLVTAYQEGFVYNWKYSEARRRMHGSCSAHLEPYRFVVFSHNHDQEGNTPDGRRLHSRISFEARKTAAAAVLLSPFVPLIFMGEEYGEEAPFLYFVSHADSGLQQAVREGRLKEFSDFKWKDSPPDPCAPETMHMSRLKWTRSNTGNGAILRNYYRNLLNIRRNHPAFQGRQRGLCRACAISEKTIFFTVGSSSGLIITVLNLSASNNRISGIPVPQLHPGYTGKLRTITDSSDSIWGGTSDNPVPEYIQPEWPMELAPWQAVAWEAEAPNKQEL